METKKNKKAINRNNTNIFISGLATEVTVSKTKVFLEQKALFQTSS